MVESCYWKQELARLAKGLRPITKPVRWSQRAHDIFLRDVSVGFFLLRRLIEFHAVSSTTRKCMLRVGSYAAKGRNVTRLNLHRIYDLYDLTQEAPHTKKPIYVANQFIHAYTGVVARDETRNWSDVLIVSDYDRNDLIWRIPVPEILHIFKTAAMDYPHTIRSVFNEQRKDYDIETN